MITLSIRIDDKRVMEALNDPKLVMGPIRDFLWRSALTVEARAKQNAPVDTNRLRNSIRPTIEPTRAMIGPHTSYAAFVEFGTRPHWAPRGALQPWARRHGFPAGAAGDDLVRRAIARRGTRAQPYMQPALEDSRADIEAFLSDAGRDIEEQWESHG